MSSPDLTSAYCLNDVWGTSGNDVFAVGYTNSWDPEIYHYNGTAWSKMTLPDDANVKLYGVWGSDSSNVFAVGEKNPLLPGSTNQILHYDGNSWSLMDPGTEKSLAGVWGSSRNDIFAVGEGATILHKKKGFPWIFLTPILEAATK